MLSRRGHDVIWADGVAAEQSYADYRTRVEREQPDLLAFETKTPVVKQHWRIIRDLKTVAPAAKVVLMGDHVTAFPAETMANAPVDYVLTGGEFDAGLLAIADHAAGRGPLVPGIWWRDGDAVRDTGAFQLTKRSYDDRPFFDRDLTQWELYYEHLYYRPCTFTMVGRDCWRPKCTFCSWTTLWPSFGTRPAESLLDEIGMVIERYGVREIFDDTGTFPIGAFLKQFCRGMVERGYDREIYFSCNMRIDALRQPDYEMMARAGFRLVKLGIESANQTTLDRIDKGTSVEDLVRGCKEAKRAGLSPHLTTMVGYPWESRDDARRTLDLTSELHAPERREECAPARRHRRSEIGRVVRRQVGRHRRRPEHAARAAAHDREAIRRVGARDVEHVRPAGVLPAASAAVAGVHGAQEPAPARFRPPRRKSHMCPSAIFAACAL
jgi:radical SAM superfamily enzyme YgiQ (UPF0313 family)